MERTILMSVMQWKWLLMSVQWKQLFWCQLYSGNNCFVTYAVQISIDVNYAVETSVLMWSFRGVDCINVSYVVEKTILMSVVQWKLQFWMSVQWKQLFWCQLCSENDYFDACVMETIIVLMLVETWNQWKWLFWCKSCSGNSCFDVSHAVEKAVLMSVMQWKQLFWCQ